MQQSVARHLAAVPSTTKRDERLGDTLDEVFSGPYVRYTCLIRCVVAHEAEQVINLISQFRPLHRQDKIIWMIQTLMAKHSGYAGMLCWPQEITDEGSFVAKLATVATGLPC